MIRTPELPAHITRRQVLDALDLLGLDSDDVRRISIDHRDGMTVTLLARDADTGRAFDLGDVPAEITAHIPFGYEEATNAAAR